MTAKWCSIVVTLALASAQLVAQAPPQVDPLAARAHLYSPKPRVVVLTDIANEPDDQMSMVRLLVYSNQFDIEGLVATTSTWMRNRVRPDVIRSVLDAYEQVHPNLLKHEPGFPTPSALRSVVVVGTAGLRDGRGRRRTSRRKARPRSFARGEADRRGRCGLPPGAARTRWRRR